MHDKAVGTTANSQPAESKPDWNHILKKLTLENCFERLKGFDANIMCTLNRIQFRRSECFNLPKRPHLPTLGLRHFVIIPKTHREWGAVLDFQHHCNIALYVLFPSKASSTAGKTFIIRNVTFSEQEAGKSPTILRSYSRAKWNFLWVILSYNFYFFFIKGAKWKLNTLAMIQHVLNYLPHLTSLIYPFTTYISSSR